MAEDDLYARTHVLLDTCLKHLDRALAEGDSGLKQQALVMRGQVLELKGKFEERQRQGRGFEEREVHVLEHVIPVFLKTLPPLP